ncbi:MAG: hypothetical protein AAGC83_08850, partial [Pseudomonadota bacterium]
ASTIWLEFNALSRFHNLLHPLSFTQGLSIHDDWRRWFDLSRLGVDPREIATLSERTLMLLFVFCMGAMGSLIYITKFQLNLAIKGRAAAKQYARPISWFIFRPLFGIVIALAVFLLVDAGQIAFGGSSGSSGTGALNLGIFSVIALFAGLLSWQALDMIESRGAMWFNTTARRDMWASGLADALRKSGQSEERCADRVGRSTEQIHRWSMLRDKVTPEMQDRLSTALELAKEELFSSIDPYPASEDLSLWGVGLAEEIEVQRLELEDIADRLDISQERLKTWIDLKRRVPPGSQWRLSDILDRAHGKLFAKGHPVDAAYAVGLRAALKNAGHDCDWLAEKLRADPNQVKAWAELEISVPATYRQRMADRLETPMNQMFTPELENEDQNRWAVGLRDAMRKQGVHAVDLAGQIDASESQVRSWMELDRPVRPDTRRRIADALDTGDKKSLFAAEQLSSQFRWSTSALSDRMIELKLSVADFAAALDVETDRVDGWSTLSTAIAPATQRHIGEVLDVHPIDPLFSPTKLASSQRHQAQDEAGDISDRDHEP